MTQTKDTAMEDRLCWENELRELLGATQPFWQKAAPFAWALNKSHQINRALRELLNTLTLGAWCWLSGLGLGVWDGLPLMESSNNLWAVLSAVNIALMLMIWLTEMMRLRRKKGVELFIAAWMAIMIALGVWSGLDESFKLIQTLPWAASLIALHLAMSALKKSFFQPVSAYCAWHLTSALYQWRQHLESQGFDPLMLSGPSELTSPCLTFNSPNEWRRGDVDWLVLHESTWPRWRKWRQSHRSANRPKLPKRLFRALSQATEKWRARGWISWAPLGLNRMSCDNLETLAQAWMPEALERTRERFELSSALPSAPKKASSSRL